MIDDVARLVIDSTTRFLAETLAFNVRRPREREPARVIEGAWPALAERGAVALTFPEALGGAGAAPRHAAAIARELGRIAWSTPYSSSALLASHALALAADSLGSSLAPSIVVGGVRVAVAVDDFGGLGAPERGATHGRRERGRVRLDGRLALVPHASVCEEILVSVRLDGCEVPSHAAFVPAADVAMTKRFALYDGTPAASLELRGVAVADHRLIDIGDDGLDTLRLLYALGVAAEAEGLGEGLVDETVGYLRQREAFGRRLSQFQALQHRVAELRCSLETMRAATAMLQHALSPSGAAVRTRLYHAALATVAGHGRRIAKDAVQLHGAIGLMWDHIAGAGLTRMTVLSTLCGTAGEHRAAYARDLQSRLADPGGRPLF